MSSSSSSEAEFGVEDEKSSPPAKKLKGTAANMQPFASLKEKSGFPMAHTMGDCPPHPPRSKLEMIMVGIGGAIRDKSEWWKKIHDTTITNKWKEEIVLPQVLSKYLMDLIDDADTAYKWKPEHDATDYDDEEEQLHGFQEESVDDRCELAKDAKIELVEFLYEHLRVQADEEGYLVANPEADGAGREEAKEEEEADNDGKDGVGDEAKEEDEEESNDNGLTTDTDNIYKLPQQKLMLALFEYALKECQWMAERFETGPSRPAAVQGVYCRDGLGQELHTNLLAHIGKLRSKPAIGHTKEDRHPGTPAMVDLVHPSMYCYEKGKTPILEGVGAEALAAPAEWEKFVATERTTLDTTSPQSSGRGHKFHSSNGLQWLPSEFQVDSETGTCHINSYINNLHPIEYADLYHDIGKLFVHCLPLLEDTLHDKVIMEPPQRLLLDFEDLAEEDMDEYSNTYKKVNLDVLEVPEFEPYKRDMWSTPRVMRRTKKKKTEEEDDNHTSLKDRPLQVIVKIASLELTPDEHPKNKTGSWHVEGCLDERIVATACCYLETDNIEGGDLQFRIAVEQPYPEQGDDFGCQAEYGIEDGGILVQPRGSCSAKAGRVLGWSNIWQHRVDEVRLIDETKPGKRTIVCFFLVDPTLRIRSTATVPPQQKAWLYPDEQQSVLTKELTDLVAAKVASNVSKVGLTYEEANERRARLMKERSDFQDPDFADMNDYDAFPYCRGFSLCEH